MTEEDRERRRPPAPHCWRVVQLGLNIPEELARSLPERTSRELELGGRTVRASSLYEPKVGGGGHLLLREEDNGTPWARLIVEPDGPMVNVVAAILDGDWEQSDEALSARVRAWLKALHGLSGSALESQPATSASEVPVIERPR